MNFRPGNAADLPQLNTIFYDAIQDLAKRMGLEEGEQSDTPEERAATLERWRPILEHLTATGDQFWVAEEEGKPLGFARSIMRDGVRELTDFFVSPHAQTKGIGRELVARTMPPGAKRNYIIATIDLRAQALYQKLGVYQICAIFTFFRKPERLALTDDLRILPITPDHLPLLANLDRAVHGHSRNEDHAWLMAHRHGFLLQRQDRPVGYGYVGPYSGPFVMVNEADYPAALAYAETVAAEQGLETFGIDIPMLNHSAIAYLLGRSYQMSPFFCFYMCDVHPQGVEKTIITSPMIMI